MRMYVSKSRRSLGEVVARPLTYAFLRHSFFAVNRVRECSGKRMAGGGSTQGEVECILALTIAKARSGSHCTTSLTDRVRRRERLRRNAVLQFVWKMQEGKGSLPTRKIPTAERITAVRFQGNLGER
jgi:hypothetical protein